MRTSLGIGRLLRKCLSLFVIFTIFTSLAAPQTTYAANYASQIVNIAKREVGKSNVGEGNKYTSYVRIASNSEASKLWCASFTAWCANQAGIPRNIIPAIGACDKMYEGVINGGGYVTSSPQAGDLVFYKNYKGKISHVGIMIDSTNSVQGNVTWGGVNPQVRKFPATNMLKSYPTMFYVHPNYGSNSSAGSAVAPVTPVTPTNSKPGRTSKPTVSVNNNNASVAVSWNSVANATSYDVYLVQEPWRWEDIKYSGSTQGTSYTFTNVKNGAYKTFVIARPNTNYVKSDWTDLFSVKKVEKQEFEVVSSISYVDISSNDFCLRVGETKRLKAGVGGFGSISLDKTWSSSNSNVASVDSNGLVTAKNPGTATIKAVSVSDSSKYDTVEVEVVATSTTSNNTPTADKTFKTPKPEKTAVPSVSIDGATVSVSWNSVANATKYDVYLVEDPWRWEDIKYSGSTQGTSYTFNNVREGVYCAFVVSRPNSDSEQSPWKGFNVNAAPTSSADFYNINASNVSQTNAQLNASISYSGNHPSEVGVYFGNSADSMRKVGSDAINHNKNPFDMWYSLNKYGVTLSPGTTYYYKMYAIMDGREVTSSVQSFTTPAQVNSNLVTARVSGTPGGLAINSQPNQYTKIGRMDEGVYCTIDLSRTSGNWYYVTYNGVSGYAYNRYLGIQ